MWSFWEKIKNFFSHPGHFDVKTLDLDTDDLFAEPDQRGSSLFMGKYTEDEIQNALKHFGIYSYLKRNGFYPVKLWTDFSNPYKHRIVLYKDQLKNQNILIELVLQKKLIPLDIPQIISDTLPFLSIEWLLLQNPDRPFSPSRPRLPGQTYPGLGIGKKVLTLIMLLAMDLRTSGLLNIPEHFHNAAMYSRRFFFLSSEQEAIVRKLNATLVKKYGLATISWAIDRNCILMNGKPFQWSGTPQIIPGDPTLKNYFHSRQYKEKLNKLCKTLNFDFDTQKFAERMEKEPIPGFNEFCSLLKK